MKESSKYIIYGLIILFIVIILKGYINKEEFYDPYITTPDVKEPFLYSTPFVWNNPTRYYGWYWPLYAAVADPYFRYTYPYFTYRNYWNYYVW